MATEAVGLEFLAKQAKLNMDEMRQIPKDLTDMMRLVNATYELTRRVERRQNELRDDIELMVKMELGGLSPISRLRSKARSPGSKNPWEM